ncbi:glycosyltransferase family 4 protein [Methylobacterium goesingense]|uniref:Glycosyltransferase involved in cell wall biosynthesis n=1 Tax=Methylobacterium goesingense TaxID=243690 RepID=A0ABV2L8W6_9HYPH|nr:glycosyltransferase family 4 protein [Methylobacterium goesingense]GJD75733.1 D-inositol-3-phosphate glycosyltransferase [Methylobacterium goesingense]
MAMAFSTYPWRNATWRERVDVVRLPPSSIRRFMAVLRAARTHGILILNGFSRADLLAAVLVARLHRPPHVVILDPTWGRGENWADRAVCRSVLALFDGDHVHYGVLTEFEVGTFPRTWGVDPARVHKVLWSCTLSDDELSAARSTGGGVFAGGNSLRDWDLMLRAAALIATPVTIAAPNLTAEQLRSISGNVTAGPVSAAHYDALLRGADIVVVPMQSRDDRASGQGTMLAAMALGKPLVVNDAPGVRDYVRDGETGIVVPRDDPTTLAAALRALLSDEALRTRLGAAAEHEVHQHFLLPHYVERVLKLMDALPVHRTATLPNLDRVRARALARPKD